MESAERSYTVYTHILSNGKKYIGITCQDVDKRWGRGGVGYKACPYFWHAIVKYGWDNITHQVLFTELTEADAKQREKDLIIAYKTKDPACGYNLTDGGDGMCGCIPSVETRALMSEAAKGKRRSLGYKHTEKALAAMSAAQIGNKKNLGHKASDSARAAMSAAAKGKHKALGCKHTAAQRAAKSAAQRLAAKDVECLTADGQVIGHYNSLAQAAEKTGIGKQSIWGTCSGKQATAGTFRWRYA